jgi:hypothetical protein
MTKVKIFSMVIALMLGVCATPATSLSTEVYQGASIAGQWAVIANGYKGTMSFTRSGNGWTGWVKFEAHGNNQESLTNIVFNEATEIGRAHV